jgi:hypothetical protein
VLKVIQGHNQAMLKGFFFSPTGEGWSFHFSLEIFVYEFTVNDYALNSMLKKLRM